MDKEAQKVAIAEACGWKTEPWGKYSWVVFDPTGFQVAWSSTGDHQNPHEPEDYYPDYLSDLNECHAFERDAQYHVGDYCRMLAMVTSGGKTENMTQYNLLHATAPQRCEAFLKTIGKWTGGPND